MTAPAAPKRRWFAYLIGGVLTLIVGFVIYSGLSLSWAYSEGDRAGNLRKFSKKGWLCKTWEGEMAMSIQPGLSPEIWSFSVRDDRIVTQMNAALGKDVVLRYKEHVGVPTSCFGDTRYFVDSVAVR